MEEYTYSHIKTDIQSLHALIDKSHFVTGFSRREIHAATSNRGMLGREATASFASG